MLPSRRAIERENRRRSRLLSQPNLSPFAALAVVFLVAIMVQPFPYHNTGVDMFKATNAHNEPGAHREDAMIVTIARDGKDYFDTRQIELSDLPKRIHASIQAGSPRKVYIRPDARAKTGDVNLVIDQLQLAGVTDAAFLTEKLRPRAGIVACSPSGSAACQP